MLAILIGNAILGIDSQTTPVGSEDIITELGLKMVTENTLQDIITE
jgi:hypothetical protein|tara:strand:- start:540 stop:677 length:138 start_codon:yes stop_codon:yes gene_type:complete